MPDQPQPAVVLIDPHSDLANAALGLVPGERPQDVVHLVVGRTDRPFGLNLLDVGLGWPRDRIVDNALRVFEMEFDHFWGPRMELVFRFALLLLVEANQRLVAADQTGGRDRQWTILEVPRVLEDSEFRRALLGDVHDRQILDWWRTFYDALDRRFQLEIINPVQTKSYKFAANLTARDRRPVALDDRPMGVGARRGAGRGRYRQRAGRRGHRRAARRHACQFGRAGHRPPGRIGPGTPPTPGAAG